MSTKTQDNFFSKKIKKPETSSTFDDVLLKPKYSDITRKDITLEIKLAKNLFLKIPFLSSPMDTVTTAEMATAIAESGGMGIIHRNLSLKEQIREVKKVLDKGLIVSAAVGPYDLERVKNLIEATKIKILTIDNAHAHTKAMVKAIKKYKKIVRVLIVGNIATKEAAKDLIKAGADVLKVGIGAGSICTTRITTGVGAPQLSAIAEVADIASKYKIPVMADGGIRSGADVAKAIAAGASAVVLGNALASTLEAPGEVLEIKGKKYKKYRGMGSLKTMQAGAKSRYNQAFLNVKELVPEGVEGLVLFKGSAREIINQLSNYLKSTLFYCGAKNIPEMQQKAEFIKITQASLIESHPHTITKL